MKTIRCATTIPSDDSRQLRARRRNGTRALKGAARLVVRVAIIGVTLAILPSVAGAGAIARPVQTQASFTLAVATPDTDVGTFATTQPVAAAVDANGGAIVSGAAVTFGSLDITLQDVAYTVELVPVSDILVSVNPATGDGAVGGQFGLLWHELDSGETCSVGPFAVQATTSPFGAASYSPSSGDATMLDGAPSIPAASGCATDSTINGVLSLPIQPSPDPPAPGTIPDPAVTVGVSFSPAVQAPAPDVTTPPPTTPAHVTHPVAPGSPPTATATQSPAPGRPGAHASAAAPRRSQHRAPARGKKSTTTTTTVAPADTSLRGVRNVVPFPGVGTDPSTRFNPERSRNSAIDPLPVSAQDHSMVLVFGGIAVVIAAVAFALGLIGRDVRRLIPARSRHTLGGPISPPSLPPGPPRSGEVRPPS